MGTSRFFDRKTVVALALLCCLLWGSSYPAIKTGYEWFGIAAHDVPTKLVFAGWRFLWAGLALLALALANPPGERQLALTLSSEHYLCLLFGLMLLAIAAVMREAVRVADENAEFI